MPRCLPLCGRTILKKEEKKGKKKKGVVTLEEEKIVRWAIDNKENWRREKEIEEDYRKIEKLVPKRFLKWRKVFGKVESEEMLTRKVWDHAIDFKKMFKLWKKRIYPLSKNESKILWMTN